MGQPRQLQRARYRDRQRLIARGFKRIGGMEKQQRKDQRQVQQDWRGRIDPELVAAN
jgi:hypothetical protein